MPTKAVTLADYAAQSNDALVQKITESFLGDVSIMDYLPLVTNPNMTIKGNRMTEGGLPQTGWGKINKDPVEIKTTTEVYEEQVSLVRETIPIDRRLLKQKNWVDDPFDIQITGAMKAHNYDMTDAFFNNDPAAPTGNEDAWAGIRVRLKNIARYKVASGLRIDCGNLTMTNSMTAANGLTFLEKLAQALSYLGATDGRGCVMFGNWLSISRFERALRLQNAGAGFTTDKDNFGRMVTKWREMKIVDIGFKRGNTATPIIPNTQAADGSSDTGSTYTSFVIVRFGDNHMKGWQCEPLKPEFLGQDKTVGIYDRVLIDWACGLCHAHNRSFAELYGCNMG